MTEPFKATRASGLSDRTILIELVKNGSPGDVFTFDELIAKFEEDTERTVTRGNVSSIVSAAKKRLLTDCERVLISVRKVGYRIGEAREHMKVSTLQKEKGKRQISSAWDTLEHVRRNEMTKDEMAKHSEQMVRTGELLVVLEQHESRLNKIEKVLIEARKSGKL